MRKSGALALFLVFLLGGAGAAAGADVAGTVRDETGGALPGVTVELRAKGGARTTVSDATGAYRFDGVDVGRCELTFTLINFAIVRRDVTVAATRAPIEVVMHLALSADVTVTGKSTFTNLADARNPAENLVGIAQSASQGAITARQLDRRPMMRAGEVVETIPGVVVSQHSGEGKANQYYLRGFNLDHGTDFATTVAGMPVNLPTHAHGHGYSDLNFMIPELVSGVQFSKGPYFAEQGDFATAGAASISYANMLDRPMVRLAGGDEGFGRALVAASSPLAAGHLLAAFEVAHNDGPWTNPDAFEKINGLVRYTRGDAFNSVSATVMGYRSRWNSTDQVPRRAVENGSLNRFGTIDPSDGGDSYRYSGSVEWQRTRGNASTKVTAYGIGYDLNLFSNFTFFLDDPVRGDQFQQADHRFVTGGKVSYRRLGRLAGHEAQNTIGLQLRNDDIATLGLYHTQQRRILETVRRDPVLQTSAAVYGQNEVAWTSWLRTLAGARLDGYRFHVDASDPVNGGTASASLVSPKGGIVLGPWRGTELYANAGTGFHSNDARGATITRDPTTGLPVDRVTPLVRAKGAEVGVRTVALRHLQSSFSAWSLTIDSELVFVGDAGTTEVGRPSRRYGFEFANYYAPFPRLTIDGDVSWSRARFTDFDSSGDRIPGSVETVMSGGVTLDSLGHLFGSMRVRYVGPRPLVGSNVVRSNATTLVSLEAGYKLSPRTRVVLDVFNLFNAADSDIDYYYPSRLRGESAAGVADVHFHPALPRTARIGLTVGF